MNAKGGLNSGTAAAALGLHRFGFGPLADTISAIASDPRGALLAGLGIIMVAVLVQFFVLWVVLLGPAVLILIKPHQT